MQKVRKLIYWLFSSEAMFNVVLGLNIPRIIQFVWYLVLYMWSTIICLNKYLTSTGKIIYARFQVILEHCASFRLQLAETDVPLQEQRIYVVCIPLRCLQLCQLPSLIYSGVPQQKYQHTCNPNMNWLNELTVSNHEAFLSFNIQCWLIRISDNKRKKLKSFTWSTSKLVKLKLV